MTVYVVLIFEKIPKEDWSKMGRAELFQRHEVFKNNQLAEKFIELKVDKTRFTAIVCPSDVNERVRNK
jgi:hypothetical protein